MVQFIETDLKANQITFLDQRFYFDHPSGQFIPSVTTILEAYPKGPEYFAWLKKVGEDADTIRNAAGERGSNVHNLTEMYDLGYEVSLLDNDGRQQYTMLEWAMFERYVEFRQRFPLEVVATEMTLCSPSLGYAGTLDRVIKLDGETLLIDIKTSNTIYPSYWCQLAAYRSLLDNLTDIQVSGAAILWLNAKTRTEGKKGQIQGQGWQLVRRSNEELDKDITLFDCTRQLWLVQNEDATPRNTTYSITHKL